MIRCGYIIITHLYCILAEYIVVLHQAGKGAGEPMKQRIEDFELKVLGLVLVAGVLLWIVAMSQVVSQ